MKEQIDLYALPADDVELLPRCGGNLTGTLETCVTIGDLPGVDEAFLLGDNKPGSPDLALRFTGEELDAFAQRWMKDRNLS